MPLVFHLGNSQVSVYRTHWSYSGLLVHFVYDEIIDHFRTSIFWTGQVNIFSLLVLGQVNFWNVSTDLRKVEGTSHWGHRLRPWARYFSHIAKYWLNPENVPTWLKNCWQGIKSQPKKQTNKTFTHEWYLTIWPYDYCHASSELLWMTRGRRIFDDNWMIFSINLQKKNLCCGSH